MSHACFDALHDLIANAIQRSDTLMRDAIPSRIKLEVTLSFLAKGNSYRNLQHLFRVSKAAISKFIPEVCDTIYLKLGDHIKVINIRNSLFVNSFRDRILAEVLIEAHRFLTMVTRERCQQHLQELTNCHKHSTRPNTFRKHVLYCVECFYDNGNEFLCMITDWRFVCKVDIFQCG